MSTVRNLAPLGLIALLGCHGNGCSSPSGNPPAPPVDGTMPAGLAALLPKTDGGLPILVSGAQFEPGVPGRLVYDSTLDDPIARWGQCLSRVAACYKTNTGSIAGCVDQIQPCRDDSGGTACCPPGCVRAFKSELASGVNESTAVDDTFLEGDCVTGFAALRNSADGGT